jgi:hypothetical protein
MSETVADYERWQIDFGSGKILSTGPEPRHIATMRPTCVNGQWEADAFKIAASPRLLRALKNIVERDGGFGCTIGAFEEAKAAIVAAETGRG